MELIEPPLFEVFEKLRLLDRQMGRGGIDISSYLLLIEMLRKGGVLMQKEDLIFLCEKLWLKPYHDNNPVLNKTILRNELNSVLAQYEITDGALQHLPIDTPTNNPRKGNEEDLENFSQKNSPENERGNEKIKATPTGNWKSQVSAAGTYSLYISGSAASGDGNYSSLTDSEMNELVTAKRYITRGDYMPVNQRHIEQTIRSNRRRINRRTTFTLDIGATIDKITRTGNFADYVLEKEDALGTDWKILIDHEGSMVAFQVFAQEFANALVNQRIGGHAVSSLTPAGNAKGSSGRIFYFKNCPVNHLYKDQGHTRSVLLKDFIAARSMNILIISDAGAARGNYNPERIRQTHAFLKSLSGHKVAWLNPVPKRRWEHTTAEVIAMITDMFEIGEMGASRLGNIVRLFKSKINSFIN